MYNGQVRIFFGIKGVEIIMEKKYVYHFEEAYGLGKELLGGKGAGLAEMTHIGVSIPEGFTITTEACSLYYNNNESLNDELIEEIGRAHV